MKTGTKSPPQSKHEALESTGERYLPWAEDPVMAYEHWHRYAYVSQFAQGKRALDLASGEGYGSALLAQTARLVIGIDIDERTVQHARRKYPGANRHFLVGSVTDIPLKSQFDLICLFRGDRTHPRPRQIAERGEAAPCSRWPVLDLDRTNWNIGFWSPRIPIT